MNSVTLEDGRELPWREQIKTRTVSFCTNVAVLLVKIQVHWEMLGDYLEERVGLWQRCAHLAIQWCTSDMTIQTESNWQGREDTGKLWVLLLSSDFPSLFLFIICFSFITTKRIMNKEATGLNYSLCLKNQPQIIILCFKTYITGFQLNLKVKIGHSVGPTFRDEKPPHTTPEQCSTRL